MSNSAATSRGTKRLSDVARVVSKPDGIVSSGWNDVEVIGRRLGHEYDEWQKGIGRIVLAKRADGNLASMIDGVGLSLPRQVGKTHLMSGLIFALCILRPGTLVIWSAHHSKTHAETFLSMQGFAQRHRVAPYVDKVYTGSGDEEVRFRNGSRILFGAREAGFGRGIPGVDIVVFDEAQILSDKALDAILATMNTSRFGLALYIGTPPRPDNNSESFTRMRSSALDGSLKNGAWVECGAEPDSDPDDREQWARANPSFPARTPVESILRLRSKLTEDSFKREALGIWDPSVTAHVIDPEQWARCADEQSIAVEALTLAVDVSPDRKFTAIGLAGQRPDGAWHVELVDERKGTAWVVPFVRERLERNAIRAVVLDSVGPASSLIDEFERAKIRPTVMDTKDVARACGQFYDAVYGEQVRHIDQPQLSASLGSASRRPLLDAGWGWNRKGSDSDIAPIVACTYALWGAQASRQKITPPKGKAGRGKVVVYQ